MPPEQEPLNMTKTPPRNNYANPHTPITSIKRPRSSLTGRTNGNLTPNTPASRRTSTESAVHGTLSPMHGVKPVVREENKTEHSSHESWVGRKVDALFSPVLSFLQQEEGHMKTDDATSPTKESSSLEEDEDEVLSECSAESMQGHNHDYDDTDEFNPWQFIKALPPYEHVKHLAPPVALPPKDTSLPDKTLVLDLDETLVHCTVEPVEGADLTFPVNFHGVTYTVHVRLRPWLQAFLDKVHGKFEIIVFTASQKVYANELLNRIDPDGKYIHHRLFRESCLAVEGNFLKDLNVLGRDLTKTVLVDNSPHAFGYQVDNGIPIESWFDCPEDRELLKLERFLRQIQRATDVRVPIRQKFQCWKLIQEAPAYTC